MSLLKHYKSHSVSLLLHQSYPKTWDNIKIQKMSIKSLPLWLTLSIIRQNLVSLCCFFAKNKENENQGGTKRVREGERVRERKGSTKIYNPYAQPLLCSLNLCFSDLAFAVAILVCLHSLFWLFWSEISWMTSSLNVGISNHTTLGCLPEGSTWLVELGTCNHYI